ncbi:hypothetical protein [Aliivibrio fischeri]|uniref:hypothetical protein n=1 Tax=Aliivibrio fischeri TaxID=668 RepID=UPI0012DA11E8|nr:hypothetical protein [Aliivibrio fischeri]MUJ39718.1 hypothetical protein [Aliivibrio fischeri]
MEYLVSEEYIVPAVSALISTSSAIIALVGLFFTYRKNKFDKRLALDKELFAVAVTKLESAFEMLTQDMAENALVTNNRSNWIMCAREIEKFKVFKSKLGTEHYQLVLESIEEYWSHKFYDVVGKNDVIQQGYYQGLHAGSVLIVYAFSSWKSDQKCQIDTVDYEQLLEGAAVFQGRYGLKAYVQNDKEYSHLAQS